MESSHGLHVLESIENKFNELLKNPEVYVEPQLEKTDSFKQLSKKSYDFAFSNNKFKGRCLPQLLIQGFDEEQIWQQSDLLNKAALPSISKLASNINLKNINLAVSKSEYLGQKTDENDEDISIIKKVSDINNFNSDEESNDEDDGNNENGESDAESDKMAIQDSEEEAGDEKYAFDDDSDSAAEMEKKVRKESSFHKTPSNKSDRFFNLSKLNEFLRIEDIKEGKKDEIASDDEIDYFQDIPSSDSENLDDDSAKEKTKKSSENLMYEDFYSDPESEGEENEDNEKMMTDDDENDASLTDQSMDDSAVEMRDNVDEEDYFEINSKTANQKTAFELDQEKIKKQIQECEKNMLEPMPWHLTGEVDASNRPIDSLVDREADFDSNMKQDILVDKAFAEKVEEIVKMAIMNKAFLDVERKYKPTEEIISYKKEVTLDQTKSKKSLAEIYEEDYIKKQSKEEEEVEDPKHTEIKKLMDSLFPQLHALFSHIPKPAIPEIKIVSNLPAVTVEEVAPTSVSDVTLLAPEEVKKKSGLIKGKTERTDTDRKRERRKKKIHQKLKEKKKLKKLESLKANPSAKISKLEKLETLKKLKQHKNTKIAKVDDGGKIKSSKDFFSRLQDTVDTKKKIKPQVLYKKKKAN